MEGEIGSHQLLYWGGGLQSYIVNRFRTIVFGVLVIAQHAVLVGCLVAPPHGVFRGTPSGASLDPPWCVLQDS